MTEPDRVHFCPEGCGAYFNGKDAEENLRDHVAHAHTADLGDYASSGTSGP